MKTVLYLLRHAATDASQAQPQCLYGRRLNPPLARLGVRQAEATRDFLAIRPIDHCYCSPMLRAVQTATIVAAPHGIAPQPLEALTDCDVGRWEGLDWQAIRYLDAEKYQRFQEDPAGHGYPGGESLADVQIRATQAIDGVLDLHCGQSILIVTHHAVNRVYLAGIMGIPVGQMRLVNQDNCGISVVIREDGDTSLCTLNAAFHLHGVMAA